MSTHTTPSPPPGGAMTPTSSAPSATATTTPTSKPEQKQRDWKFKPQNPGDGPNSPYRRKRRNSAPAHSVEAFVLHWKYDPKAAEKSRGPSKLHLQEGGQGQGQGLSAASGAGRIPPSSTGSSNGPMSPSSSSRAMAAVIRRAAPYDRRRSLPFIHDPNNTGEQLAPSHLKPTSREAEDMHLAAAQQQLLAQTLSLPPSTPPAASLSQLLYAQQYQQLQSALFTLQQQQQQSAQLPHLPQLSQQQIEPQYPLQPQALPVNRGEANAVPSALPPLSHLLNSLRLDEGSKPSAFNPVNPSPLNLNGNTANGHSHPQLQLNNPVYAQDPAVTLQTITALINTLQQSNSASPNSVPLPNHPNHLLNDPSAMAIHNILSGGGPPPPPSLPMTSAYLDPQSSSTLSPSTLPTTSSPSQRPSAFTSVSAESKMSINNLLQ